MNPVINVPIRAILKLVFGIPLACLLLSGMALTPAAAFDVLGYHNDSSNDGQNLTETALTPSNVSSYNFGKVFSVALDNSASAQPIFKSSVNITTGSNQGVQDVVFVATVNCTLYAINATTGTVLWKTSLLHAFHGGTATANLTLFTSIKAGVLDTPAIDTTTGAIYVESDQLEGSNCEFVLSAINMANGAAYANPVDFAESVNSNGNYVSGPTVKKVVAPGTIQFSTFHSVCRTLVVNPVNHVVYMGFSDPLDIGPYEGWIVGYSTVADGSSNLDLKAVWTDSPNGYQLGGIWGSGGAIAIDSSGNLFVSTGNGPFDTTLITAPYHGRLSTDVTNLQVPNDGEYGDSIVKLAPDSDTSQQSDNLNGFGLHVADYFTPDNEQVLENGDLDLGSSGPILLPDSVGSSAHQQLLLENNKEGNLYLVDRNNMGGYHGDAAGDGTSGSNNIVQEVDGATIGAWCNGAIYVPSGASTGTIYYSTCDIQDELVEDYAKAFSISNASINPTPTSTSQNSYGTYREYSTPSVSANGGNNGIVWTLDLGQERMIAYNASSFNTVIFNSGASGSANALAGNLFTYNVPIIANGHVYVTGNALTAYGLTGSGAPAAPTGLTATASNSQIALSWTAGSGATSYNVYQDTSGTAFATGITGTPFATGITGTTYTNPGLNNGTTYYYEVKAVNSNGASGASNEVSATPTSGGSAAFANPSFEIPSVGGYSYNPAGSSWTFTNNAGIQANGSAFSGSAAVAPNGIQTAFLQGVSGTLGTMSQTVSFPPGTYTISFYGAQRYSVAQPILISVDGTAIGTYTPASNSFAQMTTAAFTVTAGNHTVTFADTDSSSDKTSFIDLVSLSGGPPNITSPTTAMGIEGNLFSYTITASNGPTSYNATGLPTGLMVNTSTGVISGTPTVSGAFPIMITASSTTGTTTITLTLTLAASTDTPTMPQWMLLLLAALLFFVAARRNRRVFL
ncbi:MAG: putative Ig domain-containing protein, partial [Methylacidiphilales bacterium]|nr:putative Ig domain-containing protein [Candidatus Methylacidiphilales bacterium]